MDAFETLGRLTAAGSDELEAAARLLGEYCSVKTDENLNIIGTLGKGGKTLLLDAHFDKIALVVTAVEPSGFLRVAPCGGCDARTLCAEKVTVEGRERVAGVITSTPPHLADKSSSGKAPGFDSVFIDTGLGERAQKIISPGDFAYFDAKPKLLADGAVTSAALDNRLGVLTLLLALEKIKNKPVNMRIVVQFSSREETTQSGARTGAFSSQADEAIVVDVSFADAPGVDEKKCGRLGGGAMICVSPTLSDKMTRRLIDIASHRGIRHQLEICPASTGTNADSISVAAGAMSVSLVSVPIRNMHTAAELGVLSDADSAAEIIAQYILSGGMGDEESH